MAPLRTDSSRPSSVVYGEGAGASPSLLVTMSRSSSEALCGTAEGGGRLGPSAALSTRVAAMLPALVGFASSFEREPGSYRNASAVRLASDCAASALRLVLSRGERGLHWL